MGNLNLTGSAPECGDYCMVQVVEGRYAGRFGYRDDDADSDGRGLVYLFDLPLETATLGIGGRMVHTHPKVIQDTYLRTFDDEATDGVAECVMNPVSTAQTLSACVDKLNRLGDLMTKFGGKGDFDADLARIEALLQQESP